MLLAWDFDGVLVDTLKECFASYIGALKSVGLPPLSYRQFAQERKTAVQATDFFIQYFLRRKGKAYTPQNMEAEFEENKDAILKLRKAYHAQRDVVLKEQLDLNPVYPGVRQTLKKLQRNGTRMAVISARDDVSLKIYLKAKQLDHFFEEVIGSSKFFTKSHKLKPLQVEALDDVEIFFVDDMPSVLYSLKGKARLFFAAWGYGALPNAEDITVLKKPQNLLPYVIR